MSNKLIPMNRSMCEYQDVTWELLRSEQVRSMGKWRHHGPVTCLDHSLFVSYLSYRTARFLRLDAENPLSDLMQGICRFHVYVTPPSPLQECDFILEYDASYVEAAFS